MDLLSQHEAFLRAIFDTPDDDTPRLVYADFLQENGLPRMDGPEPDFDRGQVRAELIRLQCEVSRAGADAVPDQKALKQLMAQEALTLARASSTRTQYDRGFPVSRAEIRLNATDLENPREVRLWSVLACPQWFGTPGLTIVPGLPIGLGADAVHTIYKLPCLQSVTELILRGGRELTPESLLEGFESFGGVGPAERLLRVVATGAIDAIARHREAARLTALDLRNNDLDNDAARALVDSPYLDNLKRLRLLEGNRLRGKVWQQVIERFGEDVVE